jgi:hypothetical protein
MGSELVVEAIMCALIEEVEVILREQGDLERHRLALRVFPPCVRRLAAEIIGTHRSPLQAKRRSSKALKPLV